MVSRGEINTAISFHHHRDRVMEPCAAIRGISTDKEDHRVADIVEEEDQEDLEDAEAIPDTEEEVMADQVGQHLTARREA